MQGEKPYSQFLKVSAEKQGAIIQEQKQGEPKQLVADLTQKFPEVDFIDLKATQDKKPIKLATYRYAPSGDTKGIVVCFHSMNLYTGVFVQLGKTLAANGLVLTGFDMRGHGKSEGQRGYIDDSKLVWKDIQTFLSQIVKIYPSKPLFILGHGLGSLLTLAIVKQSKVKISGIILISAALKRPANNKVMSAISGFALKMMPNKAGLFEPNYANMFKNPNASKFIIEDKNVYHEKIVAGTLNQMTNFMKKNQQEDWPKLVTPPLLLIQGQFDKIADPQNAIKFFESIKTKDKKIEWFPKMWGGFFLEEEYPEVEERIIKWLSTKC